jgi:hypothetical protein
MATKFDLNPTELGKFDDSILTESRDDTALNRNYNISTAYESMANSGKAPIFSSPRELRKLQFLSPLSCLKPRPDAGGDAAVPGGT